MKKNLKKIIFVAIIALVFFRPFISQAALIISTDTAENITDTGARLNGTAIPDSSINPGIPTTAYFRYSATPVAPVFCNEIYGNNMISTKDINLNINGGAQSFFQPISNLQANTTYHYCAIVSNKKAIVYGTVKDFTTPPCATCAQTTVVTNTASNIGTTSATLNGYYSSTEAVTTFFEYKKDTAWVFNPNTIFNQNPTANLNLQLQVLPNNQNYTNPLSQNSLIEPSLMNNQNTVSLNPQTPNLLNTPNNNSLNGTYAQNPTTGLNLQALAAWNRDGDQAHSINTFGNISFPLLGLNPNTKYDFVFRSEKADGTQTSGNILSFITASANGGNGLIDVTTCPSGWGGVYPNCVNPNNNNGGGEIYPNGGYNPNGGGGYNPNGGNGGYSGGTTATNTTTTLKIGTIATPPGDATVHTGEGIETVFVRQIIANKTLAKIYGYQEGTDLQSFAWTLADFFAKVFGYISPNGKEIRVSQPDIAAYQIMIVGNKLTVYEYYNSKIVNIQNLTSDLKSAYGYEYYFTKK